MIPAAGEVAFRPATRADLAAVTGLEETVFGVDGWSESSVAEELTGPDRRAVVACDEHGTVVGYAVLRRAGDVADLQRIAVRADHRRHGVARALLALLADGFEDRILLEVAEHNTAALSLYAAEGFVQIDRRRRYYRDGADAVVLERRPR